jgi:RHS repeat-associated protein
MWNYSYDVHGQMTSASDGTNSVSYEYDVFGNRVSRTANGVVERFAYDGWDSAKPGAVGSESFDVWGDLDASNQLTTRRMYGAGFDSPLVKQDASGVATWYDVDHLGSVTSLFDNSGQVIGSRGYSAFGAITTTSGTGLDRYGFTAREWDTTLGLQYSRARMYDPTTGRWLSEDPMGLAAGDTNLSRYVGNNATGATDPSGNIELDGIDFDRMAEEAFKAEGNRDIDPGIVNKTPIDMSIDRGIVKRGWDRGELEDALDKELERDIDPGFSDPTLVDGSNDRGFFRGGVNQTNDDIFVGGMDPTNDQGWRKRSRRGNRGSVLMVNTLGLPGEDGDPVILPDAISIQPDPRPGYYNVVFKDGSVRRLKLTNEEFLAYRKSAENNSRGTGIPAVITEPQAHSGKIPVAPGLVPHMPRPVEPPEKPKITSIAIGTRDDFVQFAARAFNSITHGRTIKIDKAEPDWEAAIAALKELPDGSLESITFSGHGGPDYFGPFKLKDLKNPDSDASRFLRELKKKASKKAVITIKACKTCAQQDGVGDKEMLKLVAKITGLDTVGYDQDYGPVPHGQEFIVHPDGSVTEGKKYRNWEGSIEKFLFEDFWHHLRESYKTRY